MTAPQPGGAWSARRLALALALCLVTACQPVPAPLPPSGSGQLPTASAAPSGGAASPDTGPALAQALRDAIDVPDILADLERLQEIADQHEGNRAAGSAGYDASAEFVADELRGAGFEVELQPVRLAAFAQLAPSAIEIQAPDAPELEDIRDFKAMLYSGSGDVTGPVFLLGFDPAAQPGDRNGTGCDDVDWAGVPTGAIILVQPGRCRRKDVVLHAQAHGARALVTSYPEWLRDRVVRPTLVDPDGIAIPVLGTTHQVGLELAGAAGDGSLVHLTTSTSITQVESMNVIAETPGGDPARVLMVGGHLDSALDGPGMNDNGSGTMTVLEIARELAALVATGEAGAPAWKVRVAFWTGEEIAILGSTAYLGSIDGAARSAIAAYLNFDMLGSPNGVRLVYDGAGTTRPVEGQTIANLFGAALGGDGLTWHTTPVGLTDHVPFDQWAIPIGGLFAGANEIKSAADAATFGGAAGLPSDACYHLGCDTVDNVDPALLEQLARAAAWVVGALASGETAL